MRKNRPLRSSRLIVFGLGLSAAGGCGSIISTTADTPTNVPDASPQTEAAASDAMDVSAPTIDDGVPCTPAIGAEVLLCAPRSPPNLGIGDASAPFLSGGYVFDHSNAGMLPYALPGTQSATVAVGWDEQYLYFAGHMTDRNAKTDSGEPNIEFMACSGAPDSDYIENECVDFSVSYTGKLSGPARFDPSGRGYVVHGFGEPTDFMVDARIPAAAFGTLFSGKLMAFNANAVSYQDSDGGTASQYSSLAAFFIKKRPCNHDAGESAFKCGGGDMGYEPVTWARLNLH